MNENTLLPKISCKRLTLIFSGVAVTGIAAFLWLSDGAWHYGAIPTKGVIRTALFAGAGCLCLLAANWLSHRNDTND